jgi:hypothetical protein
MKLKVQCGLREMLRVSMDTVLLVREVGMTSEDFKTLEKQCALGTLARKGTK